MKKIALVLLFAGLVFSLSAADIKDTWFDTFCQATAKNLPSGAQLAKDSVNRIMFINFPLPTKSSAAFDIPAAKAAITKAIKGTPDASYIKKAEITVIYNYITTDYKIFSVVITAKDL